MDADNFISILFVVGGVIFGFIQNITKKTKEMSNKQDAQLQAAKSYQEKLRQEQSVKQGSRAGSPKESSSKKSIVQPIVTNPVHAMPVEGERVTNKSSRPISPINESSTTENPLRDKGNLIRALIYGDVLKQRF